MSNKIVYSCDTSDECSDMDVSDIEEETATTQIPRKTQTVSYNSNISLPHQKMVTSLHRYMQRDSWGENAIKPHVKNVISHKAVPQSSSSYAAVAGRKQALNPDAKLDEDEYTSDDSFHTAPNSPERESMEEECEPGQIEETNEKLELMEKIDALENKLKANFELETIFITTLKDIRARREEIRLRRLARQARNSMARNRKTISDTDTNMDRKSNTERIKGKDSIVQESPAAENSNMIDKEYVWTPEVINLNTNENTQSVNVVPVQVKKDKGKAPDRQHAGDSSQIISPTYLELRENSKRILREERAKRLEQQRSRLNEIKSHQVPLAEATTDKPFSKRYQEDDHSDFETSVGLAERRLTKRQKKELLLGKREMLLVSAEEKISKEERLLIRPDAPYYKSDVKNQLKKECKVYRKTIQDFLLSSPPSLPKMRMILMTLYQASLAGPLRYEQEELAKQLIKKIMDYFVDFITLDEHNFKIALNQKKTLNNPAVRLPAHFYSDTSIYDFNSDFKVNADIDVSYYDMYKCIRHFEKVIAKTHLRKARMYLLKSGEAPALPVYRSCDPADKNSAVKYLYEDENLGARVCQMANKVKAEAKKEKNIFYTAKRRRQLAEAEAEKRKVESINSENERLEEEIDMMASRIAFDIENRKKKKIAIEPKKATLPAAAAGQRSTIETKNNAPDTKPEPVEKDLSATEITCFFKRKDNRPVMRANVEQAATVVEKGEAATIEIFNNNQTAQTTPKDTSATVVGAANNNSSVHYKPYRSALTSLGLSSSSQPVPRTSTLCSAESAGGVCNVKNCPFTHFKDFL